MEQLSKYISEKLSVASKAIYSYRPSTTEELYKIINDRLSRDKDADLNDIDVSQVEDMSYLFRGLEPHKIDLSQWDVSSVRDMKYMFYNCKSFNSDISQWDVSNVKDMNSMFYNCKKFNSDLSRWDVSNVKIIHSAFKECKSLDNIPSWYKK